MSYHSNIVIVPFQALIDARSLLAELVMARKRQQQAIDTMSVSSAASSLSLHDGPGGQRTHVQQLLEGFNIVSLQSTARPGCIIELDAIADAVADWQHTQLLHVFQVRADTRPLLYVPSNRKILQN